ncbi:MAG: hypothetical protein KGL67_01770 [Patescibacteria group bacterium]|nr:hypothetical protein [Patescibacteria group bacterium]
MKTFIKINLIFILFLTLFAGKVFAADISVSVPPTVNVGDTFEALINMNSDGVPINSADIVLNFDQSLMSFSGYKTDNTFIGIWLDSPHEKNGSIYMSGIIPGGVSGLYDPSKKGLGPIPLVRLLFSAKTSGNAVFSFSKTEILEHNGSGTALPHSEIDGNTVIENNIDPKANSNPRENILDKEKPEPFNITFLEASMFSRTPSMIIFKANDAGSGIKEYKMNIGGSMWTNVQSPYPISKVLLSQTITIRAYDFAGNFQDSSITIPGLLAPSLLWTLLALFVILCILCYKLVLYKR